MKRYKCSTPNLGIRVHPRHPWLNTPKRLWHIRPMRTSLSIGFTILFCCVAVQAEVVPLRKLDRSQQDERITGDLKAVEVYRQGLFTTLHFALQQTNLFPASKRAVTDLPPREEKEVLWTTWKSYLDYL